MRDFVGRVDGWIRGDQLCAGVSAYDLRCGRFYFPLGALKRWFFHVLPGTKYVACTVPGTVVMRT